MPSGNRLGSTGMAHLLGNRAGLHRNSGKCGHQEQSARPYMHPEGDATEAPSLNTANSLFFPSLLDLDGPVTPARPSPSSPWDRSTQHQMSKRRRWWARGFKLCSRTRPAPVIPRYYYLILAPSPLAGGASRVLRVQLNPSSSGIRTCLQRGAQRKIGGGVGGSMNDWGLATRSGLIRPFQDHLLAVSI
jgi:hypothetical protein